VSGGGILLGGSRSILSPPASRGGWRGQLWKFGRRDLSPGMCLGCLCTISAIMAFVQFHITGPSPQDSIPDLPARSQSLYRLSHPAHYLDTVTM